MCITAKAPRYPKAFALFLIQRRQIILKLICKVCEHIHTLREAFCRCHKIEAMLSGKMAYLMAGATGVGRCSLAAGCLAVIRAGSPSGNGAEPVWRPFRGITTKDAGEAASKGAQNAPKQTAASTNAAGPPQQASASSNAVAGTPAPQGLSRSSSDYALVLKLAQQLAVQNGGGIMTRGSAGIVSGVRDVALSPRRVLIFRNARSPEQQGRQKTGFNKEFPHWSLEFLDVTDKWVNRLIGWTSSPDTKHQAAVALQFYEAAEAIAFCERQGWDYEVEPPNETRGGRGRRWATYGDNFSIKRHGLPDMSHLPSNQPQRNYGGAGGGAEDEAAAGSKGAQHKVEAYGKGAANGSN